MAREEDDEDDDDEAGKDPKKETKTNAKFNSVHLPSRKERRSGLSEYGGG